MSDFAMVQGFEDVWRPPVRPRRRTPEGLLAAARGAVADPRARLTRIAGRAPEVMVKVTGRTRDGDHLRAHLDYITRHGALEMDGPDGAHLQGQRDVRELAEYWAGQAMADSRRRVNSPMSLSVVLSMPDGVESVVVWDAARSWARGLFEGNFDYVMALHTDAGHPHVHVAVCARGYSGERLNPKKADLPHWREVFARALRERGIDAEATPRRARGVTRKSERIAIRKLTDRHRAGEGHPARVRRSAYHEAARRAFGGRGAAAPWEAAIVERQRHVRAAYLKQARLLQQSADPGDRALGFKVEAFVRAMPAPDTQTLAMARELRAARERTDTSRAPDTVRSR